ncbi:sigma-70 family RNA polymerase sigma factor [bacterium]|nr:sigma-70 family RNA polymerase sigma factor [bacterium]
MDVAGSKRQAITSYSDEDLFFLMSLKDKEETEAQEAFRIFYKKYDRLLWSLCYSVCSKIDISNVEELAKCVFNNTMIAIYEHPTYDAKKSKLSTWMSRIAYHETLDLISDFKINDIKKNVPLNEKIVEAVPDTEEIIDIETPEKKLLSEALDQLTDRDREILLTCMMYKEEHKHTPDEILLELSNKYNTTTVNIRQIRKRALDKVKAYITTNADLLS